MFGAREDEIYNEGRSAYLSGASWYDNPYNGGCWEETWSEGFEDAADEKAAEQS